MSGLFLCKVSLESMRSTQRNWRTSELDIEVTMLKHWGRTALKLSYFRKAVSRQGWKSAIWYATKTSLETTEYWTKETLNSPIRTPSLLFEENEAQGTKRTSLLTHTANFKQNLGHSSCLLMTQIRVLLPSQAALQSPLQSADRRLKKEVGLYV